MNDYTTQDIYLAATLSALDYPLLKITQIENKFIFHFDANHNELIDNYWAGDLLVDPKRLFTEFKEIKSRMYDLRRSYENSTA